MNSRSWSASRQKTKRVSHQENHTYAATLGAWPILFSGRSRFNRVTSRQTMVQSTTPHIYTPPIHRKRYTTVSLRILTLRFLVFHHLLHFLFLFLTLFISFASSLTFTKASYAAVKILQMFHTLLFRVRKVSSSSPETRYPDLGLLPSE